MGCNKASHLEEFSPRRRSLSGVQFWAPTGTRNGSLFGSHLGHILGTILVPFRDPIGAQNCTPLSDLLQGLNPQDGMHCCTPFSDLLQVSSEIL